MRVCIGVDTEGIGGINHPHPTDPKDVRHPASVDLMVGEANAAIEGTLGADTTDILVRRRLGEPFRERHLWILGTGRQAAATSMHDTFSPAAPFRAAAASRPCD
jgi:D-aminopeptidase